MSIIHEIAQSPILAFLGAMGLLFLLLVPITLRLAGLTGGQIIELCRATLAFLVEAIREFRCPTLPPDPPRPPLL